MRSQFRGSFLLLHGANQRKEDTRTLQQPQVSCLLVKKEVIECDVTHVDKTCLLLHVVQVLHKVQVTQRLFVGVRLPLGKHHHGQTQDRMVR